MFLKHKSISIILSLIFLIPKIKNCSSDEIEISSSNCISYSKILNNEQTLSLKKEYNDVLFTHAGVESGWLEKIVKCDETDINKIADAINDLLSNELGMRKLYCITSERGGRDRYGSCVWADVHDIMWDKEQLYNSEAINSPIIKTKQVFGHTLQAYYDIDGTIKIGDAIEFENSKMIDTENAYELNIDTFTIKKL